MALTPAATQSERWRLGQVESPWDRSLLRALRGWSSAKTDGVRERRLAPRRPYPAELREPAVWVMFEHQEEYPTQWQAIESIAKKLTLNHETLRQWVRRAETDAGQRPGLTSDERARMKQPERENWNSPCERDIEGGVDFLRAELDPQSQR